MAILSIQLLALLSNLAIAQSGEIAVVENQLL
jgi:hypothetical protein